MLTRIACMARRGGIGLVLCIGATTSAAQVHQLTEPTAESLWTASVDAISLSPQEGEPYVIVGDRHFILKATTNVYRGGRKALRTDIRPGGTVTVTPEPGMNGRTPLARRIDILEFTERKQ